MGIDQLAMKADGLVFAVRRIEADYLAPAQFEDVLEVLTTLDALTPARMVMGQEVWRDQTCLFRAVVTIVCIGAGGKPARLPAKLRSMTL
jgi:acyl-CoA thioester hydrolase